LLELIELEPPTAVSPDDRAKLPAVTFDAFDDATVAACEPDAPLKLHVASTPEYVHPDAGGPSACTPDGASAGVPPPGASAGGGFELPSGALRGISAAAHPAITSQTR
jgi:hypothetical protein